MRLYKLLPASENKELPSVIKEYRHTDGFLLLGKRGQDTVLPAATSQAAAILDAVASWVGK